jgi:PncC family amidohydrolase
MLTHEVIEKQVLQIIRELSMRKQTVGFAESCTGGSLSAALAAVSGASQIFKGSVIAYANEIKIDILGVPSESLFKHGAVSAEVAREMSLGVQRVLNLDWAISITGIAGPNGGSEAKPVGTVFISVAGPNAEKKSGVSAQVRVEKYLFSGNRAEIQKTTVHQALTLLIEEIEKLNR